MTDLCWACRERVAEVTYQNRPYCWRCKVQALQEEADYWHRLCLRWKEEAESMVERWKA